MKKVRRQIFFGIVYIAGIMQLQHGESHWCTGYLVLCCGFGFVYYSFKTVDK